MAGQFETIRKRWFDWLVFQTPCFSIRLAGNREKALHLGVTLKVTDLDGRESDSSNGVVAEVCQNPQSPDVLGLRNQSTSTWNAITPRGEHREVPPGRSIRLAGGTQVYFGKFSGRIECTTERRYLSLRVGRSIALATIIAIVAGAAIMPRIIGRAALPSEEQRHTPSLDDSQLAFSSTTPPLLQAATDLSDPRTAEAEEWCQKGREADLRDDLQEALQAFSKAIDCQPAYAPAYRGRGSVNQQLKRNQEAVADESRALELDSRNLFSLSVRSQAYRALNQEAKALADLRLVLELQPDDPYATKAMSTLQSDWSVVIVDELLRAALSSASLPEFDVRSAFQRWMISNDPNQAPRVKPLGGLHFNVLRYAEVDRRSGKLTLYGEINPRFRTGPIPYLELLQTAWTNRGPSFSLDWPESLHQNSDRFSEKMKSNPNSVLDLLRQAVVHLNHAAVQDFVLNNFQLNAAELARLRPQIAGSQGKQSQTEAFHELFERYHRVACTRGLILPPKFMAEFAGFSGQSDLRFENVPAKSQLGRVLYEADCALKYTVFSQLPTGVAGDLESEDEFAMRRGWQSPANSHTRVWFKLDELSIGMAMQGDRTVFQLRQPPLVIDARRKVGKGEEYSDPQLSDYVRQLTNQCDQLAIYFPAVHELREAIKVLALAEAMRRHDIPLSFPSGIWNVWPSRKHFPAFVEYRLREINTASERLNRRESNVSGGVTLSNVGELLQIDRLSDISINVNPGTGGESIGLPLVVPVDPSLLSSYPWFNGGSGPSHPPYDPEVAIAWLSASDAMDHNHSRSHCSYYLTMAINAALPEGRLNYSVGTKSDGTLDLNGAKDGGMMGGPLVSVGFQNVTTEVQNNGPRPGDVAVIPGNPVSPRGHVTMFIGRNGNKWVSDYVQPDGPNPYPTQQSLPVQYYRR